ncbi:MAG TPA: cyclic nucleotide-binding domain-containing protein [Acidimicrobiales bacterium]|nr:cyclic nucleotide-binding domain-containing protein [Acidimicrobiales bacterium]
MNATTCRIVRFVPGRRPTDEAMHPGLGSSDCAALVTGAADGSNQAIVLFDVAGLASGDDVDATVEVGGRPVPGWHHRPLAVDSDGRHRLTVAPDDDMAGVDLGFSVGFLQQVHVRVRVVRDGHEVAADATALDLCEVSRLGLLYERIIERLLTADTARQAAAAGVDDPGVEYHPWFPVLRIGGDKAALYTRALVADIVGKQRHLTDPAWLLRVGVYLELLTCLGVFEAVRDEAGDLLDPAERAAFETNEAYRDIRGRLDPDAWRRVWALRTIEFPRMGRPRTGPVSAMNLLQKKRATLQFLHVHHDDLKHAIELAGANHHNAQETWQRVFRDAERAVLRQTAAAFPELGFFPRSVRERVLWQRWSVAGHEGLYATACHQYRASMNAVAEWAKVRGLMDHAGDESVPVQVSLLEAHMHRPEGVAVLQRRDGYSERLDVTEPVDQTTPTTAEIEALLTEVAILRMLSPDDLRDLAAAVRPLLLGPTERFVVQGDAGDSLFVVGDGEVEILLRRDDGDDVLVETMGRGAVVGEMSLLTGERRSATVRAVGGALVLEIGFRQYQPLLQAHPEWLDELATIMEERLQRREVRLAAHDAARTGGPLRERIRRRFFGSEGPAVRWSPSPAV